MEPMPLLILSGTKMRYGIDNRIEVLSPLLGQSTKVVIFTAFASMKNRCIFICVYEKIPVRYVVFIAIDWLIGVYRHFLCYITTTGLILGERK